MKRPVSSMLIALLSLVAGAAATWAAEAVIRPASLVRVEGAPIAATTLATPVVASTGVPVQTVAWRGYYRPYGAYYRPYGAYYAPYGAYYRPYGAYYRPYYARPYYRPYVRPYYGGYYGYGAYGYPPYGY